MMEMKIPIFDFYVYQIYRKRGDDKCRARIFRTFEPGHYQARETVKSTDEGKAFLSMIESNDLDVFFISVKRKGTESQPSENRGYCEMVSDMELSENQVEHLKKNRVS